MGDTFRAWEKLPRRGRARSCVCSPDLVPLRTEGSVRYPRRHVWHRILTRANRIAGEAHGLHRVPASCVGEAVGCSLKSQVWTPLAGHSLCPEEAGLEKSPAVDRVAQLLSSGSPPTGTVPCLLWEPLWCFSPTVHAPSSAPQKSARKPAGFIA